MILNLSWIIFKLSVYYENNFILLFLTGLSSLSEKSLKNSSSNSYYLKSPDWGFNSVISATDESKVDWLSSIFICLFYNKFYNLLFLYSSLHFYFYMYFGLFFWDEFFKIYFKLPIFGVALFKNIISSSS
jgi:hypothetical protein